MAGYNSNSRTWSIASLKRIVLLQANNRLCTQPWLFVHSAAHSAGLTGPDEHSRKPPHQPRPEENTGLGWPAVHVTAKPTAGIAQAGQGERPGKQVALPLFVLRNAITERKISVFPPLDCPKALTRPWCFVLWRLVRTSCANFFTSVANCFVERSESRSFYYLCNCTYIYLFFSLWGVNCVLFYPALIWGALSVLKYPFC